MILKKIAEATKLRVEAEKKIISPEQMKQLAYNKTKENEAEKRFWFEQVLKASGVHFICEVKKASPSKGVIAEEFPYVKIAKGYQQGGADCISVLTEPQYFLGKNKYLEEISKAVTIPTLRKDFTIDPYQIYQAKVLGASCVLLICSLLSQKTMEEYLAICNELNLSALVEAHDEEEIQAAIKAGARILGINNRNLKTFEVDIHNSERLRKLVPDTILFVAESGIQTPEDIEVLRKANINGVLIGETLMRSKDKGQMIKWLKGQAYDKD